MVFAVTPCEIGLPCRAGAENWEGSVQKKIDRYSLLGFFSLCVLNCWIHFGTEEDLKAVLPEILWAVSTKSVQLHVSYTGLSTLTVGCLPFGKRHKASRLTSAAQDRLSNPHHLLPSTGSSANLFRWTAHLTLLFAVGKAGSYFPWLHPSFHPHSLLLPPEEDSAAIRHSNHWKWPVQDNWKGIWAITGILISDSSRKELNSFLLVLLGLMFDRKWVWRVQEQVTELALLPAALPTLTVCLQKSDTLAYY